VESGLHPTVGCLSELTTLEEGLIEKKVDATTAPTSGTGNAEYSVQLWNAQTAHGKKGPANAASTSANARQGLQ